MTDQMDQIERDLSQSRDDLKDSVSALGDKLTFGQIIDEVIEKAGLDLGSAKAAAANAGKLVLPGAVLGAGVALLIAGLNGSKKSASSQTDDGYDFSKDWHAQERYRSAVALEASNQKRQDEDDASYSRRVRPLQGDALGFARAPDEEEHTFHNRIERGLSEAKAAADKAGERLATAAKSAIHGVGAMAHETAGAVHRTAAGAGRKLDGALHSAAGSVRAGTDRVQQLYGDNPVLGVAVGLCVGAILGSIVPLTRKEQEMLGEPMAKAAADLAERGERAAQEVGRGVRAAGAEHRAIQPS